MDKNKQIEEMAKSKKCNACVHNAVCQELEEFRDPLGWISTEDEFVCSYYAKDYRKSSDVAREIFEEIEREINDALQSNYKVLPLIEQSEALWNRENGKIDALRGIEGYIAELKNKYTESENNNE